MHELMCTGVMWVALLLPQALRAAEAYSCEFVDLPPWLVEGAQVSVNLRYTTPAGAQPAGLHCEMKADDGQYLHGQAERVSGTGVKAFTIEVPSVDLTRKLALIGWLGEDWREPLSGFARPPLIEVLSQERGKELKRMEQEAVETRNRLASRRTATGHFAIYGAAGEGWARDVVPALSRCLTDSGYGVSVLDAATLANPYVLTPDLVDALVLADVREVPAPARDAISRYLGAGGKAMFLGGPAFEHLTWSYQGRSLDTESYRAELAKALPVELKLRFEDDTGGEWRRSSNNLASPAKVTHVTPGALGSRGAIQVSIENLTGWDTFTVPASEPFFGAGHSWTSFWAKGDAATPELSAEWRESDGSRWIATLSITKEWRQYVLPPSVFRYWHDSGSKGRGGPGDAFRPEQAQSLAVGLAHTHTTAVGNGPHGFWIDEIGSLPPPDGQAREVLQRTDTDRPLIECVSPGYKLYPVTNLARLRPTPGQAIAPAPEALTAKETLAPHPRPQGTGLGKDRRWRYVPLLDCLDQDDRVCGNAAVLVLNGATAAAGGVVVSVPVTDPGFFRAPVVVPWLADLVGRVAHGLFLYEGGARYFASFGDENIPVGALVSNRGRNEAQAELLARVADSAGRSIWEKVFPVTVKPGAAVRVEAPWSVPAAATETGPFRVTVELREKGAVIDRLSHEVVVWRPKPKPEFVVGRQGGFWQGATPWFAHGVNYMPSTGIGIEDTDYFEFWLDPQPYDPESVERDLTDIQAMGLNLVSVFQYHRSMNSRNLLDLLVRCEAHGLKVNLSLRPGTPLDFPWDLVREMIGAARLAENDTVLAYDLAWEPHWRDYNARKPFDPEWQKWIVARYGTLGAAEKAWGCPAPRADGALTCPSDQQVSNDGDWRQMVLDYRRFLDQVLDQRYGRARELVRTVDPNHLVSFRMSIAGDPTVGPAAMPYDFAGLAKAVDLFEPEGYGRIGDWEQVKPGWFTTAYGRCVAPELPVMWAEFGYSVWGGAAPDQGKMEFQAGFYDRFYDMVLRSGANGTACWWFPGGYRWNERSDYGIVNPDRSWRPVTHVIRRWAPKLLAPRSLPQPDTWLTVRLYEDVDGIHGLYRRLKADFWQAVDGGRTPGLRRE